MLVAVAVALGVLLVGACGPMAAPQASQPATPPEPTANLAAAVEAAVRATAQAVPTPSTSLMATVQSAPTSISQEDAVASVKRYNVLVVTEEGGGSGISLGAGRILTNFHIVDGANRVLARFAD